MPKKVILKSERMNENGRKQKQEHRYSWMSEMPIIDR